NILHSTISETTNKDISPIKANFDTQAVQKLKSRQQVVPAFELETVTPTPASLPTQIISPQNASEGGKLLL
ncbi:MAG: hypothetical protein Q7K55_02795, partial [Candidatus Levybacteria bacterium]|nr:hypothetical protein [Candidatus Levybacteria bacterium]